MRALKPLPILLALFTCVPVCSAQTSSANQTQSSDWKEFVSSEGHFSVLVPGTPSLTRKTIHSSRGDIESFTYDLDRDGALYSIMYIDIPISLPGPEATKRALDAGRNNMFAKFSGLQLVSEKEISLAGNPGREALVYNNRDVIRARHLMVKNRLYLNVFLMPNRDALKTGTDFRSTENLTERFEKTSLLFLDSFKLLSVTAEAPGEVDQMLSQLKGKNLVIVGAATSDTPVENQITGGVINGKAVRLVQPQYPAMARAAHASGRVSVQVIIDYEGNVAAAQVKEGNPLLWGAALKAARESKFNPTTWKGKPVMVAGLIIYNFVAP
ncbi:MAG TPA: TonB family protein [Pyrinomonadaceae bacterium]|nr:TonB family protein [Pyrinomonadaceae bacterium]